MRSLRHIAAAVVATALLAGTATNAAADVPQTVAHQGRLYDGSNMPVSGSLPVVFTLYDGPGAGANVLWTEAHDGSPGYPQITFDEGY